MAEITPTLDIVPVGPEYIISKPLTDEVFSFLLVSSVGQRLLLGRYHHHG